MLKKLYLNKKKLHKAVRQLNMICITQRRDIETYKNILKIIFLIFSLNSSFVLATDLESSKKKENIAGFRLMKILLEQKDVEIYSMVVRQEKYSTLNQVVRFVSKDGDNILHFIVRLGFENIDNIGAQIIFLQNKIDRELFFKLLNRKNKKGLTPKEEAYKLYGKNPLITSLFAFTYLNSGIQETKNVLKKTVSKCYNTFLKK